MEFAPEMAENLREPFVAASLGWHDPPRGPLNCTSKRGWRFGPSLDALLAFALERFGCSSDRKQKDFVLAWEEYFQCMPDENKLVGRFRNQLKANNPSNALVQFAQRVKPVDGGSDGVVISTNATTAEGQNNGHEDHNDGDDGDDGDNDDNDHDGPVDNDPTNGSSKQAIIEAALRPYKKDEWPAPKSCHECKILITSGEMHSCLPCSGVAYCPRCASGHSGAHTGVFPVTQWDVRLPPTLGTKQIKSLAKELGVTEKELRRFI